MDTEGKTTAQRGAGRPKTWIIDHPDRLSSYFKADILPLALVTVTGIIYNVGLTAGPWFEGQLVQRLYDITQGTKTFQDMVTLALLYLLVIGIVQGMRCLKRFYVRRFANDTSRSMRHMLYNSLVYQGKAALSRQSVGTMMTKAIADVDACVEGMRKFTTELFDTGVALIAYLVMLFIYDWRLALIASCFTPLAYLVAAKMKKVVYRYNAAYKKSAGSLNDATLDRVSSAITYRVFGRETDRDAAYEEHLSDYEKRAIMADVWGNTLQPLYQVISLAGVVAIIYLGARNVLGNGWTSWDLAAFTAFLSCFTKMAKKSSSAAKLFNAVQKAQVSWQRIKPLMRDYISPDTQSPIDFAQPMGLSVEHLSFSYPEAGADEAGGKPTAQASGQGAPIIDDLSFSAAPGEVIGITGPVASGKSTLGKVFLCETPYEGSVRIGGHELRDLTGYERSRLVAYQGHEPELMSDTIEDNIELGDAEPCDRWLAATALEDEVAAMGDGAQTSVGNAGVRLSGGQQARIALARTLCHAQHVLVLDDPFSAVDKATEHEIWDAIKAMSEDKVIVIISHRLDLFPEFDQVIWLPGTPARPEGDGIPERGRAIISTHDGLMRDVPEYRHLFTMQMAGGDLDEA